jgi:hypothetical protein
MSDQSPMRLTCPARRGRTSRHFCPLAWPRSAKRGLPLFHMSGRVNCGLEAKARVSARRGGEENECRPQRERNREREGEREREREREREEAILLKGEAGRRDRIGSCLLPRSRLVCLVYLVYLVCLVCLVCLVQSNLHSASFLLCFHYH